MYPFYIVDVFCEGKYTGNQLAVVRDAGSMDSRTMQSVASEMHFSETAFILADMPREGAYDVRIFTPGRELPFAGHPTLGTAWIIREKILQDGTGTVVLNLGAGRIPVSFGAGCDNGNCNGSDNGNGSGNSNGSDNGNGSGNSNGSDNGSDNRTGSRIAGHACESRVGGENGSDDDDNSLLWMRQNPPEFLDMPDLTETAAALGLAAGDLDARFPVQAVTTGLPFIIVPLRGMEALKRCHVVTDRFKRLIASSTAKDILVFCRDTYHAGHDLAVRVFNDDPGYSEDAATGSANGCLAAYLLRYVSTGSRVLTAKVGQGYEIGRPSLLHIKACEKDGVIGIDVGGRVVLTAKGELI